MNSVDNDDRFAPPRAAVNDMPEATDGLVLASRGSRLGAAIIDVVVAIALAGVATWIGVWRPWADVDPNMWHLQILGATWGFALFVLAHGYLLAKRGQTIGKLAVGLRIVRPDGSAASFARLVGMRYGVLSLLNTVPLVGMLFGVADGLCIFRASRRCLHDDIADTVVIKA